MAERVGVSARTASLDGMSTAARAASILPVLGCSLMMVASAQVRAPVPWSDVPMTLQLLAVVLTGFALPASRAVAAMLLYLGYGLAGLPVFAGPLGLFGPTGGYLLGFVLAVWLVSTFGGSQAGVIRLFLAGLAGMAAVFATGVAWRLILCGSLGLFGGNAEAAVITGTIPFMVKGIVEVWLAVMMVVSLRGLRGWRQQKAGQ